MWHVLALLQVVYVATITLLGGICFTTAYIMGLHIDFGCSLKVHCQRRV